MMSTIEFKDKAKKLKELQYAKLLSSLPLQYGIYIKRTVPVIKDGSKWDEEIMWSADDSLIDHKFGETLMFNHLLSIIDHMASADPAFMSILKDYVLEIPDLMEIVDDSNFNK
jgi:hypothetical protein